MFFLADVVQQGTNRTDYEYGEEELANVVHDGGTHGGVFSPVWSRVPVHCHGF